MAFQLQDGSNLLLQGGDTLLTQSDGAAAGPTIDTHPAAESVSEGNSATFTVAATTSGGALSYQWYETTDGLISGATSSTLVVTTVISDDGNGYYCAVTDDNGTTNSNTAALTVAGILSAVVTPSSPSGYPTDEVVLTVAPAGGTGAITQQWYLSGVGLIIGETGLTLTIAATLELDGGQYYAEVTDDLASVESNYVTLSVDPAPSLGGDISPVSPSILAGETEVFTCTALGGSGTKTYQWYQVGVGAMGGETAATLSVTPVTALDDAQYYCEITDDYSTVNTGVATLNVYPALEIVTEPASAAVSAGSEASFSVEVTGNSPFTYQWHDASGQIAGETGYTLDFTAHPGRAGDYYVLIGDDTGQIVQSANATLTVDAVDPTILLGADDVTVASNVIARFDVSASGYGGLAYQWYEVGVGALAGETARSLFIDVTAADDGRQFYCDVTNYYATTSSATGTLTVVTVSLDDQSDPMEASTPGPQKTPTYTMQDWVGLQLAAEGSSVEYHDEYRFNGRTFRARSRLTTPRTDEG